MNKSNTPGRILSLLHLGHSVRRREPSVVFYNEGMNAKSCKTQRSDAPYLGEVNGVKAQLQTWHLLNMGKPAPWWNCWIL